MERKVEKMVNLMGVKKSSNFAQSEQVISLGEYSKCVLHEGRNVGVVMRYYKVKPAAKYHEI